MSEPVVLSEVRMEARKKRRVQEESPQPKSQSSPGGANVLHRVPAIKTSTAKQQHVNSPTRAHAARISGQKRSAAQLQGVASTKSLLGFRRQSSGNVADIASLREVQLPATYPDCEAMHTPACQTSKIALEAFTSTRQTLINLAFHASLPCEQSQSSLENLATGTEID